MSEKRTYREIVISELFDNPARPGPPAVSAVERERLESDPARWSEELAMVIGEIQSQLTERNTALEVLEAECEDLGEEGAARYEKARLDHKVWRGKAMAILSRAQPRRGKVKRLVHEADLIEWRQTKLVAVLDAIVDHEQATRSDDDLEPSEADLALWSLPAELLPQLYGERAAS